MDLHNEIEDMLKIPDQEEKTEKIEELENSLREKRAWETEGVGEAAAFLLKCALVEPSTDVQEAMFSLLVTAVGWHRIDTFLDWDTVIAQIPHFTGNTLLFALEMLGWSREQTYIPFLEKYLDYPRIQAQITALEAISQIWWDKSDKSDEVKKRMKIEAISHIWNLLNNPKKHPVPETQIQEQLLQVQQEFMKNMRDWFEIDSGNAQL